MYALGKNFCLNPFTVTGNVAEKRHICRSAGHLPMSASSTVIRKQRWRVRNLLRSCSEDY